MSADPDSIDSYTLGSGTPSAPAAPTQVSAPDPGPTAGPLGIDPRVVWTAAGETPLAGIPAFASVVMNRVAQSGGKVGPGDIVTEPGQFPGRKQLPIGSPEYNAYEAALAPYVTGQTKPPFDFTAYRTHGYQSPNTPWNGSAPLTTVAGNDYATIPYKYGGEGAPAAPSDSIDDYRVAQPAGAAAYPHFVNSDANPAAVNDGTRQIVPNPKTGVFTDATGTAYTPAPEAGNGYFKDPKGALYQITVPTTANAPPALQTAGKKPIVPPFPAGQSPLDRLGIGAGQGVGNVGLTFNKLGQWLDQNSPLAASADLAGHTFLGLPTATQAVAQGQVARDRNDLQYGSSPMYGLGKFAGETAATVPVMAATDGLGGMAIDALDAGSPLLANSARFLAGSGGRGNLLTRGASLASGGALQGAQAAAINSGASEQPLGSQVASGASTGALLGPTLPLIGSVARGATNALGNAGRMVGNAFLPLTDSGRQQIADNMIRRFASDGPTSVNAAELVPGSSPTLAQATANPGLAGLERAVRDIRANQFISADQANAAARIQALTNIAGTPETIEELEAARDQKALPLLSRALSNANQADASPVVSRIDEILDSPAGQRDAVKSALTSLRGKLVTSTDAGGSNPLLSVESDPSQLYGIRQSITDALSPLAARSGSNAQLAARELMDVKGTLDSAIEQAAPGYKDYLTTYSRMSGPANAQSYLQGLNLTDAQGNMTLAKVKGALTSIAKKQQLPGVNDAKSVTPEQIGALQSIYDDLQRASNSGLGRSIGSNTFQNLATNNLMANVGAPAAAGLAALAHHPAMLPVAALGRMAYSAQNEPIINALTERLLDPQLGGRALNGSALIPRTSSPLVRNLLSGVNDNAIPAAVIGRNQLNQGR